MLSVHRRRTPFRDNKFIMRLPMNRGVCIFQTGLERLWVGFREVIESLRLALVEGRKVCGAVLDADVHSLASSPREKSTDIKPEAGLDNLYIS